MMLPIQLGRKSNHNQNNDEKGIIWPINVAPYKVAIVVINPKEEEQLKVGEELYNSLNNLGIDTLIDDRTERAGVKFNDIDLLGIPIRITVGQNYSSGEVELKLRNSFMTEFIDTKDIVNKVKKIVENY